MPLIAGAGAPASAVGLTDSQASGDGLTRGLSTGNCGKKNVLGMCGKAGAPSMVYAGCNQGEYTMEMTYKYVGAGAGEFNVVESREFNYTRFAGAIACLIVLLLVVMLVTFASPPTTTTGTIVSYDCTSSRMSLQSQWSASKTAWCCHHSSQGCKPRSVTTLRPKPAPSSSRPAPKLVSELPTSFPTLHRSKAPQFDCSVGFQTWTENWSAAKKVWCCDHERKGCADSPGASPPGPQSTDSPLLPLPVTLAPDSPPGTPAPQPKQTPRTKSTQMPALAVPFDCGAGFHNWVAGWSVAKKAWCCQHLGKACPPTPSPAQYDCADGFDNWAAGWSLGKKAWCCKQVGKGCNPVVAASAAPPAAGPSVYTLGSHG